MHNGGLSTVNISGEYSSRCGYCKSSEETSVSFGMAAIRLTVQAYQDLLDRGWRRSGTWLYLPLYEKTCCPCYTHRLDILKFTRSKAQAKIMRRFQNFLSGGDLRPSQPDGEERHSPSSGAPAGRGPQGAAVHQDDVAAAIEGTLKQAVQELQRRGTLPQSLPPQAPKAKPPRAPSVLASGVTHTCPLAFSLSSQLRKAGEEPQREPADLAHLLAAVVADSSAGASDSPACPRVEAAGGHLNFFGQSGDHVVATSPPPLPPPEQPGDRESEGCEAASDSRLADSNGWSGDADSQPAQVGKGLKRPAEGAAGSGGGKRRLEVVMRRSSPDLVELEYPLFRKYQMLQHKEPAHKATRKSFRRFLIDTPLVPVEAADCPPGEAPSCGFGSFHQQYWIDGVLVAVGVVDILPSCLSSKYFFWDPDLAPLALGKVSAMLEIDWLLAAHSSCPSIRYYYMGYYIHTCPKMRYKTEFAPADLLCPKRLVWLPFASVIELLDAQCERALSEAPGVLEELGPDSIPAHIVRASGAQSSSMGVLDILAFTTNSSRALPLRRFLEHNVVSPLFVQHYGPVLQQLLRGAGPVARILAMQL